MDCKTIPCGHLDLHQRPFIDDGIVFSSDFVTPTVSFNQGRRGTTFLSIAITETTLEFSMRTLFYTTWFVSMLTYIRFSSSQNSDCTPFHYATL
jgi:hypothetical protein